MEDDDWESCFWQPSRQRESGDSRLAGSSPSSTMRPHHTCPAGLVSGDFSLVGSDSRSQWFAASEPAGPPFTDRSLSVCDGSAGTLARSCGRWHWTLELTTHSTAQAAVLSLIAGALLLLWRHRWLGGLCIGLAIYNADAWILSWVPDNSGLRVR